jgi:cellobiose-specific phosphotransferase system component IIC
MGNEFPSRTNQNLMTLLLSPFIGSAIWIGGGGGLLLVIIIVVLILR